MGIVARKLNSILSHRNELYPHIIGIEEMAISKVHKQSLNTDIKLSVRRVYCCAVHVPGKWTNYDATHSAVLGSKKTPKKANIRQSLGININRHR